MQIDPIGRTVRLSIGELARFRRIPQTERLGGNLWRAGVGQEWHKRLEAETLAQVPNARFEVPIKAIWTRREWTFELEGRMDQLIPQADHTQVIREIKTVRRALPEAEDTLVQTYPEYFAQIATYFALARVLPEYDGVQLRADLVLIDIDRGTLQEITLGKEQLDRFEQQLDALIPFLNERRNARLQFRKTKIQPAFEALRDGQAELFKTLKDASIRARAVLLEAPTGFGKTGIVLEHALHQMQDGVFERCIYLTSKSTGQLETIRQLRAMVGDGLRFIQMRNRQEHRIESAAHTCTGDTACDAEIGQRWLESKLQASDLFENETLTLERAKAIGLKTGLCPYALTRACLPFAEVWIGDSNYVFSPASRSVFFSQYGFDPARTLLIVDEAHNLPDRVADALSLELSSISLVYAMESLRSADVSRRLLSSLNELTRLVESLSTHQVIDINTRYELLDLGEDLVEQLKEARIIYETLPADTTETIWKIPELVKRLSEGEDEWFFWASAPGTFRATCLRPAAWIAECMKPFGESILMSATLAPTNVFRESCGLSASETVVATGHAPWREATYDVAIDCRVDTRFRQRDKYYETTAKTIASFVDRSPGEPVAIFFASYQYAENIKAYLNAMDPFTRVQVQPRGVDLAQQQDFIEEALLGCDAIFLILGSSYAEGIDALGGRIKTTIVVGPALAEVNPIQDAKMDRHPSMNRDIAFRDIYIIPAMRRIHQALGRLVRAPGHRARVLLHGKRFADPLYKDQLAPEYQDCLIIENEAQFLKWLS